MSMQITLFRGGNVLLSTCDMWLPFVSVFYMLKFLTYCRLLPVHAYAFVIS